MSEDSILERAKAADLDLLAIIDWGKLRDLFGELIAEVEQLRSERGVWIKHYNDVLEANARITELEAQLKQEQDHTNQYIKFLHEKEDECKRLEAAFLKAKRCPTCNGKGMIRHTVMHRVKDRMEDMSFNRTCPLCSGKGEQKAREALEELRHG